MAMDRGGRRGRRGGRPSKPKRPGRYKITADDILLSLGLRQDLKDEVKAIRDCLGKILRKYDLSKKDRQAIEDCLDSLQGATEPIAFGFGDDNP